MKTMPSNQVQVRVYDRIDENHSCDLQTREQRMTGTRSVIFYSWQSDLPNATNWGFIQDALEKAARAIRNDDSLEVQPTIDRDTSGVPGSPDIAQTIFSKIDQAQGNTRTKGTWCW